MPSSTFLRQQERHRQNVAGVRRTLVYLAACFLVAFVVVLVRQSAALQQLLVRGEDNAEGSGEVQIDVRHSNAEVDMYIEDLRQWVTHDNEVLAPLMAAKDFRRVEEVPRVKHEDFSFETFFTEYEMKGLPVVIEGVPVTSGPKWTRKFIEEVCGESEVKPVVPAKKAGEMWGNLDSMPQMRVKQFLRDLEAQKGRPDSPYMHDWPLPARCPALLANYTVPKYFTQDYLAGLPLGKKTLWATETTYPYGHSWPSLFIGEATTGSGLHIDSAHTHFVMHMIEGVKDFRFISRHDRVVAYENRDFGTFDSDLFKPNFTKHPMLALCKVHTTTLRDGDLLFIPGGTAHQVVNRSPVISISTNYADASNIARVMQELEGRFHYDMADRLQDDIDDGRVETEMNAAPQLWRELVRKQRRKL